MPFNYYLSLSSSSLKTPLDLALAGHPLAIYCIICLTGVNLLQIAVTMAEDKEAMGGAEEIGQMIVEYA